MRIPKAILHWAPTYGSKTGTGLATHAWLKALCEARERCHEFTVITTVEAATALPSENSPSVYGSTLRNERFKKLDDLLPATDIVHFHGGFDLEISLALRLALKERSKRAKSDHPLRVILTPHGAQSWQVFKRGNVKKLLYWHLVDRKPMAAVDAYICNTPSEADDVRQRLPGTTVHVVPLALPEEYLYPAKDTGMKEKPPSDDPLLLCTLGRYDIDMKGLDILIGALRLVNESGRKIRLRCIGYDAKGGAQSLQDYARNMGCGELVDCVGPMWGDEKMDTVRSCDLFCVPSRYESFGFSLFDGLSAGLPILIGEGVCAGSLLPQALRDSVTVKPTMTAWASAIMSALDSPEAGRRGAESIHRTLMKACDSNEIAKSLIAVYGQ